jgi:hypothetical protein
MNEVQKMAIRKVLRTLEVLKDVVQYAVEFDGETYGNRKLAEVKDTKRTPRYPHGATRKYYLPYLDAIKEGGVTSIPFGQFDGKTLSSNISAACFHIFGKGNATVHMNKEANCIEVLIVPSEKSQDLDTAAKTLMDIWDEEY